MSSSTNENAALRRLLERHGLVLKEEEENIADLLNITKDTISIKESGNYGK
jgi:transcriptional regulator with XRE-family HTH domain